MVEAVLEEYTVSDEHSYCIFIQELFKKKTAILPNMFHGFPLPPCKSWNSPLKMGH
jgi:hypothetical protein